MIGKIKQYLRRRLHQAVTIAENESIWATNQQILNGVKLCGAGVGLYGRCRITGAAEIEIGDNVHIGSNAFIRAEGGLAIGDNTHISRNLVLYTINHRTDGDRIPYDEVEVHRPVSIGRNVWIGMNVCITPGTRIGDGAVIGMGTVVAGTVPPLAIVVGQKWRIVGMRDGQHYADCESAGRYGGPSGVLFAPLDQKE